MGFFFTILFLFLVFVRPQDYVEAIKGWPIMDFVAGISLVAIFLDGSIDRDKFNRSVVSKLVIIFWVFLALTWVPRMWLGGVVDVLVGSTPIVATYFLIMFATDNVAKLRFLLWSLILIVTFLAVDAIVQFYTGVSITGQEVIQRGEVMQAKGVGLFADPNDLALSLVPFVAFLMPSFHKGLMSRTWFTGFIFLVPFINAIVLTRSRGGVLGLAAVIWLYLRKRVGWTLTVVGFVIMMALLMAIPRMDTIDVKEGSARTRLDHWSYGLQLFKSSPVWGVAKGAFTEDYPNTAHNSYILILAEGGFIGTFIWIAMFYFSFRSIWAMRKLNKAPPWLEGHLNAMEASLVGWLVCAFFLSHTYKYLSFILMAIIVATMNVLARQGYKIEMPWTSKDGGYLLGITAGSIVFMYVALRILWAL